MERERGGRRWEREGKGREGVERGEERNEEGETGSWGKGEREVHVCYCVPKGMVNLFSITKEKATLLMVPSSDYYPACICWG